MLFCFLEILFLGDKMESLFEIKSVGYYISKVHHTNYYTKLRTTNMYEFDFFVKVNEGGASFVDDVEYPFKNGNMIIAPPGTKRYSKSQFECYFIHFKCNDEKFREKYLDNLPNSILPHNTSDYINIFKAITDANISKFNSYQMFSNAKLCEMISMLYSTSKNKKKNVSKYAQYEFNINDAVVMMETNFKQHITLKEMAEKANLSPSYFHVVFKDIKGISPYDYLFNIRINCAKNLIINSTMSFNEIAEESGFTSQAYLNYVFKKEFGVTPNEYRKEKKVIL